MGVGLIQTMPLRLMQYASWSKWRGAVIVKAMMYVT